MASAAEIAAMERAIELGAQARGISNPNPSVGAVVLDATGAEVGSGVTAAAGGPHAEIVALAAAGAAARGATLVVTLEPCRHVGRTGPCTEAIIAAEVRRVVVAVADPTEVAGGGVAVLREAGVDVEMGVCGQQATDYLEPWLVARRRGRPYITYKYAATLDGRVAAADGTSRWITGPLARLDVHRERLRSDAVIAGIGTVLADDPVLTVRDIPAQRTPLRVVVDSDARTPVTARVLDGAAPTLVAVADGAPADRVAALRETAAEVTTVGRRDGRVAIEDLVAALADRDVNIAMLEGGATLAAGFVRAGLIDRLLGYYAPAVLGAGRPLLEDIGIASIDGARRFETCAADVVGGDVRVVARVNDDQGRSGV